MTVTAACCGFSLGLCTGAAAAAAAGLLPYLKLIPACLVELPAEAQLGGCHQAELAHHRLQHLQGRHLRRTAANSCAGGSQFLQWQQGSQVCMSEAEAAVPQLS